VEPAARHFSPRISVSEDNRAVGRVESLARSPNSATLRPEYRLLIACSGAHLSPDLRQEIGRLLDGRLDWPLVLETARAQRVVSLSFSSLRDVDEAAVPDGIIAAFRAGSLANAARNLRLAGKLIEIDARAARAGIPLVPYKGPVLAEMAYGNLGQRAFVDLDFIVPHRHLRAAWEMLADLGYRPPNPALAAASAAIPGEYLFLAPGGDFHLELHTELTLRHFPAPPDLGPLLDAREPVTIAARRVLTFSREDTLTLLAVHGAKDFWAQLLWICDIAALYRTEGFDGERALECSGRLGCRRMVHIALLLARDLFETPIPGEMEREVEADAVARRQARWLAGRLFQPGPIGLLKQARYRMQMVEGFWPGLRYAARLATTPAADDWNTVRLPAPLGFAYALLRPLRLLRR